MTDNNFYNIISRMECIDAQIQTLIQFKGTEAQIDDLSQEYIQLAQIIGLKVKSPNNGNYATDAGIVEELPVE